MGQAGGGIELAELVVEACEEPQDFKLLYPDNWSIKKKIEHIAKTIYGADGVSYDPLAEEQIARYEKAGFGDLPICIHPGAGAPVKLWRNEAWAQVADTLTQQQGAMIILTGSAEESPLCKAIAEQMTTKPIVAAGDTDLGGLAAMMARCQLAKDKRFLSHTWWP